jgi:hypothetical protein
MNKVRLVLALLVLIMAGCGDIQWFPPYHRAPTTPDAFTFPVKRSVAFNKEGTLTDTSDPITVAGLTGETSPISVTAANSAVVLINGAVAPATGATVKNTDVVAVRHTTGSLPATSITSTVTIGDTSAPFTSVTQNVETFAKTGTTLSSGSFPLVVATGTYAVSVTGGSYAINNGVLTNIPQTVSLVNGATTLTLVNLAIGSMNIVIDGVTSTYTTTATAP